MEPSKAPKEPGSCPTATSLSSPLQQNTWLSFHSSPPPLLDLPSPVLERQLGGGPWLMAELDVMLPSPHRALTTCPQTLVPMCLLRTDITTTSDKVQIHL